MFETDDPNQDGSKLADYLDNEFDFAGPFRRRSSTWSSPLRPVREESFSSKELTDQNPILVSLLEDEDQNKNNLLSNIKVKIEQPQQRSTTKRTSETTVNELSHVKDEPLAGTIDERTTVKRASGSAVRKNPWGTESYADLIVKAILSSAEQRLTLSQIYDWLVQNVEYFKDKGDANSSAGWKNSIRHNLSLHSYFVKSHNEGPGKSSWWTVDVRAMDAKKQKTAGGGSVGSTPHRRRVQSLEHSKMLERKRQKAVQRAKRGSLAVASSTSSSVERGPSPADSFLQLGPAGCRIRTTSNASSMGNTSLHQEPFDGHFQPQKTPPGLHESPPDYSSLAVTADGNGFVSAGQPVASAEDLEAVMRIGDMTMFCNQSPNQAQLLNVCPGSSLPNPSSHSPSSYPTNANVTASALPCRVPGQTMEQEEYFVPSYEPSPVMTGAGGPAAAVTAAYQTQQQQQFLGPVGYVNSGSLLQEVQQPFGRPAGWSTEYLMQSQSSPSTSRPTPPQQNLSPDTAGTRHVLRRYLNEQAAAKNKRTAGPLRDLLLAPDPPTPPPSTVVHDINSQPEYYQPAGNGQYEFVQPPMYCEPAPTGGAVFGEPYAFVTTTQPQPAQFSSDVQVDSTLPAPSSSNAASRHREGSLTELLQRDIGDFIGASRFLENEQGLLEENTFFQNDSSALMNSLVASDQVAIAGSQLQSQPATAVQYSRAFISHPQSQPEVITTVSATSYPATMTVSTDPYITGADQLGAEQSLAELVADNGPDPCFIDSPMLITGADRNSPLESELFS